MARLEGESLGHANNNGSAGHAENLSQSVWKDAPSVTRNHTGKDRFGSVMSAADPFEASVIFDFKKIDKNGNGRVTVSEVDDAIAHGNYFGRDERNRLTVPLPMTLKSLYNQAAEQRMKLPNASNIVDPDVGFTKEELLGLSRSKNSEEAKCFSTMSWWASQRTHPNDRQGLKLYTATPEANIKPQAVNQGFVGDCSYMAAISSMANTPLGRRQIQNMISDNQDGTFTVKFPGSYKPITVDAPTAAEHALYANGGGNGMWGNVLEKAFGKHENSQKHLFPSLFGTTVQAQALEAIDPCKPLKLLTNGETEHLALWNRSSDGLAVPAKEADVARILSKANDDGSCVTAAINDPKNPLGLPSNHGYSVLKYDASHDEITIRNPWGRGEPKNASGAAADGTDDGIFKISLKQFQANFGQMEWSKIQENK